MTKRLIVGVLLSVCLMLAQRRVDPRFSAIRVICMVPLVGNGTAADPRRPEYAPWPVSQDPNGIIAFAFVPTDDGKSAIAEFVARNRAALLPILNDKSVTSFEKGRASKSAIESALKQFRKDFDMDKYGMVMP